MNGIRGVSFQEVPGGLIVRVKKDQKTSKKSSAGKLKKRLPYSFKQMSKQIMQAKTANAARPLVSRMQAKLSWLYKKLRSGEYGDGEITAAIIHAAAMERIAKRKVRHLEEEEAAENGSCYVNEQGEEAGALGEAELEEGKAENPNETMAGDSSTKEMKHLLEEMEELEREMVEESLLELQDMFSCAGKDLTKEELGDIKRKHRSEEERQLMHADLKYLKALFDRLEQEKRQSAVGGMNTNGAQNCEISYAVDCVPEVELAEMDIGESFDITV